MSREVVVRILDDLDKQAGKQTDADTEVLVGIQGRWFLLDLTTAHAEHVQSAVEMFTKVGTLLDEHQADAWIAKRYSIIPRLMKNWDEFAGYYPTKAKELRIERNRRLRAWAPGAGYEVQAAGKIQDEVIEAYEAAHPDDTLEAIMNWWLASDERKY